MTLVFVLDLDNVETIQHAGCLGQMSFSSKIIVRTHRNTDTHTNWTDLLYLDH